MAFITVSPKSDSKKQKSADWIKYRINTGFEKDTLLFPHA